MNFSKEFFKLSKMARGRINKKKGMTKLFPKNVSSNFGPNLQFIIKVQCFFVISNIMYVLKQFS